MIFIERNHFVHHFFGGIAAPLGLLDLLRVTPLLNNEVEYVEHVEIYCCYSRAGGEEGDPWVFKSAAFDSL